MANEQLRRWRELTPSPSGSGQPMTRAELAEAVNQYVWEATGKRICLDADTLGRYERGQIRWPGADYRAGLRAVLGVVTDNEIGFHKTPRGRSTRARQSVGSVPLTAVPDEMADPVNRRQFLQTLAMTGVSASLDALSHDLERLAPVRTVAEADIARLRSIGEFFTSWAHVHGGHQLGHSISAEMSNAVSLLKTPCPPRLRTDLLRAVGQLGVATGSLLFDTHDHVLSERILAFATDCAEDAQDWHLRAKCYSWRARQAIWFGDARRGLGLAQGGLERADRLTATEQAMLHTAAARAYGRLGDTTSTIQAVGAADDAFAHADPTNDVPWMTYYDHAQHAGDTGHALFELAVNGVQTRETARRLTVAITEHPDAYIRSRAFSGFKLAALTMRNGDPLEAVGIARSAAQDSDEVTSRRLRRTALEITAPARRHRSLDDVAELLESLPAVGAVA